MRRARITPLLMALALSVLAHAYTLSGGWLHLSQPQSYPPPLMAHLEPLAPAAPASVKRKLAAKPAPIAVAPAGIRTDTPVPWTLPDIAAPAMDPDLPQAPATTSQTEQASSTPEPVIVASATPTTIAIEPAIVRTLPKRGRITYSLNYYLSNLPTVVGRTVQTWEAVDNTYRLDSLSETVGLARLTRFGPRIYHSSGIVTERGLLPGRFTSKVVVSNKSDDAAAQFDWDKRTLQFGRTADQKSMPLPSGAQDLLSFMYQLSLAPPPRGRIQMSVTNGAGFEHYELDVFDEETIETPMGNLRALPVKQVRRDGHETIEVWLAAEYNYLPVRIRFIGRDGTPGGEQVATEISVGEK